MNYKYFGLKFGRMSATVSLDRSFLGTPDSHTAVWLGVNDYHNKAWVQGGVEDQGMNIAPQAYIEVGKNGNQAQFIHWPVQLGEKVKVKLRRVGKIWTVTVKIRGTKIHSRSVHIIDPTVDSMLEIQGKAKATAHIDRRQVRGNTL